MPFSREGYITHKNFGDLKMVARFLGLFEREREVQRGKISFNAHSILSTSSRMTRIDCWFFTG